MSTLRFAGFWIRVGATLLDTLLLLLVVAPPLTAIYGKGYWHTPEVQGGWDILLSYVLPAVACVGFWMKFRGTPGKLALKLRVVDARTGAPVSLGQATIRYLGYIPATVVLGLGILWVAFDPKKQGWHDKMAGTVVVRDLEEPAVVFDAPPKPGEVLREPSMD